jgi:D-mannonate dehydratase|tara:strand:- start:675 stop:1001 length:327 start_codon:yes stop_codon:yes gene_type:complete
MNFKKIIFLIIVLIPLNACLQSTALMGPGVTVATSGNIAQAGFQYGTNKIIEKQTGKNTLGLITDVIEDSKIEKKIKQNSFDEKKFHENFKKLVEKNFYKTRDNIFHN